MKKIILFICFILFSTIALSAKDFKLELHNNPSIRQLGYGGFYTTDKNNFYSLYANPASLASTGKHALIPSLSFDLAGPLSDSTEMLQNITNIDPDQFLDIIKENNGIKLGVELLPLLSFGGITEKGFGWGFSNSIYAKGIVPSLLSCEIIAGNETSLVFGYGRNIISTDSHTLALGANGKLFTQIQSSYTDSPLQVTKAIEEIADMPMYVTPGLGLDLGVLYTYKKWLDVGLVCHDAPTVGFVTAKTFNTFIDSTSEKTKVTFASPNLALGAGFDIPVDWSKGAISSFRVLTNYSDLISLFDPLSRNPLLNFSVGTELTLFKVLSFRAGLTEMYPSIGLGLRVAKFNIDFAMYGRELGLEPGSSPIEHAGLFIGFYW